MPWTAVHSDRISQYFQRDWQSWRDFHVFSARLQHANIAIQCRKPSDCAHWHRRVERCPLPTIAAVSAVVNKGTTEAIFHIMYDNYPSSIMCEENIRPVVEAISLDSD